MTMNDRSDGTLSDTLAGDLLAVVRRHHPAWTGSNASDQGATLLEIGILPATLEPFPGKIPSVRSG
jgi:hypothetical protein